MEFTNNREKLIHLVEQGGATKESLIKELECTEKSLASVFTLVRLMGHYPMKGDDGVYYMGSQEDFEAAKIARAANSKAKAAPKTPAQALDAATKREDRAAKAATTAEKRFAEDASRENELRQIMAKAELELSSILLGKAQADFDNAGPAPEGVEPEDDGGIEPEGDDLI